VRGDGPFYRVQVKHVVEFSPLRRLAALPQGGPPPRRRPPPEMPPVPPASVPPPPGKSPRCVGHRAGPHSSSISFSRCAQSVPIAVRSQVKPCSWNPNRISARRRGATPRRATLPTPDLRIGVRIPASQPSPKPRISGFQPLPRS